MRGVRRVGVAVVASVLVATGCSSDIDRSQVAAGPGDPVVTTPPLAVPPVLRQPERVDPFATTAPLDAPAPTATVAATATAAPTVAPAAPTPAAAVPPPTTTAPTSATTLPTAQPTQAPTVVPAPAPAGAPQGGASIPLGDFEVVNLNTGATQNIASLAPSGATMLWFWAPH